MAVMLMFHTNMYLYDFLTNMYICTFDKRIFVFHTNMLVEKKILAGMSVE